jgi:hypothetical protein
MRITRNIPLLVVAQALCLFSFGQNATADSTAKNISKNLLNHGYYQLWEGQPWENRNGMEIPGYTDLDRRIHFNKDSTFEEVVFKDRSEISYIDTGSKTKVRVYLTTLYSGAWKTSGDTIQLNYNYKKAYPEAAFGNCYYLSMYKKFKCDIAPLFTSEYTHSRLLLLKNEKLCEVGYSVYCYR